MYLFSVTIQETVTSFLFFKTMHEIDLCFGDTFAGTFSYATISLKRLKRKIFLQEKINFNLFSS